MDAAVGEFDIVFKLHYILNKMKSGDILCLDYQI